MMSLCQIHMYNSSVWSQDISTSMVDITRISIKYQGRKRPFAEEKEVLKCFILSQISSKLVQYQTCLVRTRDQVKPHPRPDNNKITLNHNKEDISHDDHTRVEHPNHLLLCFYGMRAPTYNRFCLCMSHYHAIKAKQKEQNALNGGILIALRLKVCGASIVRCPLSTNERTVSGVIWTNERSPLQ